MSLNLSGSLLDILLLLIATFLLSYLKRLGEILAERFPEKLKLKKSFLLSVIVLFLKYLVFVALVILCIHIYDKIFIAKRPGIYG
jgi:hypothetical protein